MSDQGVTYRARQNVARWLLPKGAMVIKRDDSPEARARLSKRLNEVERITERGVRRALDEGQALRDQARLVKEMERRNTALTALVAFCERKMREASAPVADPNALPDDTNAGDHAPGQPERDTAEDEDQS